MFLGIPIVRLFGYAYYLANRDKLKLVAIDSGYGCVSLAEETLRILAMALSRPIFIYAEICCYSPRR